jgi:hypothetical protein
MKNRVHKLNENDTELLSTDKAEIHPFSSRPPRKIFEEVYHKSIQLGLKPEDFRHLLILQNTIFIYFQMRAHSDITNKNYIYYTTEHLHQDTSLIHEKKNKLLK